MNLQYDLIALDVDGTLLTDDHELLEDVKDAVQEAASAGAQIVLCTGRGPMGALPILEELGQSGILITHNGASTIESEDRKVLFQYDMEPEHLWKYIEYCRRHSVHFDVSTAFEMMLEGMTSEAQAMYEYHRVVPLMYDFDRAMPEGLLKFTIFGSAEEMDSAQAAWELWPPTLQSIRSGELFIDVQHPSASKGNALQQLAEGIGIDRSRIMAIGNYFNDVSMLEYAGLGIAMGNSPLEVQKAAAVVAASNNECGVASALRQFAWS